MNKGKISYKVIVCSFLLIALICYMCLSFKPLDREVHSFYQVYLGNKKIGLIKSDRELYNLIDEEQKEIKDKFKVDKVYSPLGLNIQKVITYKTNVMTVQDVYDEIKDIDPFTIEGYEVTIKDSEGNKKKVYILNKDDLDVAVRNTVVAFVPESQYDDYLNGTQDTSGDEFTEITDIYFDSDVSIKKTYISTEENIITNADDLSLYFLFGKTELNNKYTIKENDTIESIAYDNELGVSDFLVANPDIGGENALLAVGQKVNVAPVSPLSNIVVESFETEYQTVKYETKIEYDKSLNADQSYVKQNGSNGLSKVTFATREMNGVVLKSAQVSNETIKEAVDKVVVYGAKNVVYYGNTTYWAWPTVKPFRISSYYGYRVHPIRGQEHFHSGVDITGVAKYDLYAIQSGTIIAAGSGWNSGMGTHIKIDHGNGYTSVYMHMSRLAVKKGDHVEKGQLVGYMGCTGSCTGTHLHLTMYKNGTMINPLNLYK